MRALRFAGISIGAGVRVGPNIQFESDNLTIDSDSVVGRDVRFVGLAHIHVQERARLDPGTSIGDVRISAGGSGLAIHYPVALTGGDRETGEPTKTHGPEPVVGEVGHGTN